MHAPAMVILLLATVCLSQTYFVDLSAPHDSTETTRLWYRDIYACWTHDTALTESTMVCSDNACRWEYEYAVDSAFSLSRTALRSVKTVIAYEFFDSQNRELTFTVSMPDDSLVSVDGDLSALPGSHELRVSFVHEGSGSNPIVHITGSLAGQTGVLLHDSLNIYSISYYPPTIDIDSIKEALAGRWHWSGTWAHDRFSSKTFTDTPYTDQPVMLDITADSIMLSDETAETGRMALDLKLDARTTALELYLPRSFEEKPDYQDTAFSISLVGDVLEARSVYHPGTICSYTVLFVRDGADMKALCSSTSAIATAQGRKLTRGEKQPADRKPSATGVFDLRGRTPGPGSVMPAGVRVLRLPSGRVVAEVRARR